MTCLPLCCPQCCTHREFEPAIDWSDSVRNRQFCGTATKPAPRVVASVYAGGSYYLLAETFRYVSSTLRVGYEVQKWTTAGVRTWKSAYLYTASDATVSAETHIASDGTTVWAAVSTGAMSRVYRLSASTGAVSYSGSDGAGDDYLVTALCPDGAGKVLIGRISDPTFISTWDDDTLTNHFGSSGCSPTADDVYARSIVVSGSDVYVGHDYYAPTQFAGLDEGSCGPLGSVSKYNTDRELVWCSGFGEPAIIAVSGSTVYGAWKGDVAYYALESTWGDYLWSQGLDVEVADVKCGSDITGIAVDGTNLWLSACRWVYQLDPSDGTVVDAVPHVHEADITSATGVSQVLAVSADGSGNALGGGRAVPCDPDDPLVSEERTSTETACGTFTPGCTTSLCDDQTKPDWCHTNDCGSITTNGRFAISECAGDLTQMPPCSGPGAIRYTQCDGDDVTESFTFTSECSSGGRTWTGEFGDGGSIEIEYICGDTFGPENITLVIPDCSVTVDSASINCDGPLGYAVVEFSFTGTCGECEINGCGVFGAEDCETGIATDCCGNVPESLPVSMSSTFCSYANGVTGTATWNASLSQWECVLTVTTAVGDKTWGFALECPAMGGSAQDFTIRELDAMSMLSADCEPNAIFQADMTSTCDPFELTVIDVEFAHAGMGQCCDDGTPMSPAAKATIVIG